MLDLSRPAIWEMGMYWTTGVIFEWLRREFQLDGMPDYEQKLFSECGDSERIKDDNVATAFRLGR